MQQRGWGKHSRDALRDMIGRGPIKIIRHSQDKYGRTVGQIIRGRTNINLQMVKAGQAAVYPHYCDDIQYYMAEALAQKRTRGIWKIRGNHQTPWQFRRNKQNKKGR
jgi:endonuclease YncB( thermonuclease family)